MKTPEHTNAEPIKLALSRREAATALGVSPVTVDRLTERGLLTPSRATRRPLYALTELERFLHTTRAEGRTRISANFPGKPASAGIRSGDSTTTTKGKAN